ncbi:hypothetical protein Tco_0876674 [Tanacetum coccineum]|uniref:Uncharacterized protein n=1 Tax=Tanacetum coccineum TaxID=301880 RepID=A0ABQ5BW41_9ASTR
MMLLARAITQRYSTPTNNCLRTSSNTRNHNVIQGGNVDIQSKNVGYAGNGNRNTERQNMNQETNAGNGLMLLATKDEARVHLDEEVNDFMLYNDYGDNTLEELNATMTMMARIQPTDDKSNAKLTYDVEFISEVNASQVDMINELLSKSDDEQQSRTSKKAIEVQPKIYYGEKLKSTKLKVDLPDYEETLEDAEESRLKMKDTIIQLDYAKLNALYKSFVPQTEIPVEQTYFSSPSTFNVSSESSSEKSDLPPKKMPNESKLLKLFVNLETEIKQLRKLINISFQREKERTIIYDEQNEIRKYFS